MGGGALGLIGEWGSPNPPILDNPVTKTLIMDQFLDPTKGIKLQFLDPEIVSQSLNARTETDINGVSTPKQLNPMKLRK